LLHYFSDKYNCQVSYYCFVIKCVAILVACDLLRRGLMRATFCARSLR